MHKGKLKREYKKKELFPRNFEKSWSKNLKFPQSCNDITMVISIGPSMSKSIVDHDQMIWTHPLS